MKFSETWLREWVDPPINSVELARQLTMIGFKVDELKPISKIFYGIVIGEIIECKPHPNLKKIWIITVNNGNKIPLNIICDSNNCRKHMKVVVANIGATLPNGNIIKLNTTIQEQLTEGILCTPKTLDMADDKNHIIELPQNAPIGKNFYDYLYFHDKIININVTPNRGDCLSVMGLAREIAVINQLIPKKLHVNTILPKINDTITVSVEAPKACPQYLIKIIKKINIFASTPLWIKEKLRRCGISSMNIVTDIINYVLIELGHPIHVFDYEKMSSNNIQVRFSTDAEYIMLSDNQNIKLLPNTLIVSNNTQVLSIAGIIVSNQYCINHQTRNIVLQSAFFSPKIIANQSRLYNIQNLSSFRYTRGVDPNISQLALERVTSLLLDNCNEGHPGPVINITNINLLPKPIPIILHRDKLNKILGFYIKSQEIIKTLKKLGFQIILLSKDSWKVFHPTWRFDISIEENVISEIIRIHGYNKIPNNIINTNLIIPRKNTLTIPLSKIKYLLLSRGYQEIITYSFVNPNIQKLLYPKKNFLNLKNPITLEMSSMRLSLWVGLIEAMVYNQKRQTKHIKFFETGTCFVSNNIANKKINQDFMIAGIRSGLRFNEHWDLKKYPVDFYDIKGDVEALLRLSNKLNCVRFKKSTHSALHPTQNAAIYLKNNNICIGYIGLIHPTIQTALNIRSSILVFELKWNLISKITFPKISKISKFPKNCRDLSIIIADNISAESVINICAQEIKNELIDIKLIDVYKDLSIPKNHKSLTIRLFLQSSTHNFKEQDITNIVNHCIMTLKKNFDIILR